MSHTVTLSDTVVEDLALPEIAPYFLPSEISRDPAALKDWLAAWLTADPAEIARRSGIILALTRCPAAQAVLKRQPETLQTVRRLMRERGKGFLGCAASLKLLRLILTETQALTALQGQDAALDTLLAPICGLVSSPAYAAAREQLARAEAVYQPLETLTMGVNMLEDGSAIKLFLMDLNRDTAPCRGVFEADAKAPDALFSPIPLRDRGPLSQLEVTIRSHAEHVQGRMLSRTATALSPFPEAPVQAWMDWCETLPPILAGLNLALALQARGLRLCRPVCDTGGLRAEALYSVELTLRAPDLPVPCDAEIRRGSFTLVTGVNHSGKTTFLKALAHAQLLGQLGFPLPAGAFSFVPARHLFTLFSRGEQEDVSRFEREALDLQRILREADADSVVWFNEPFTSTAASDARTLLLDAFSRLTDRDTASYAVTHLYELYEPLAERYGERLASFATESRLDADGVHCGYRLERKAPDARRYARQIAESFGLSARQLLPDPQKLTQVEAFLDAQKEGTACL